MARKLDQFPLSNAARYPWDEYLDGSVWELTRGEDFRCSVRSIQGAARAQANRRRGTVRMRTRRSENGREVVVMQFIRPALAA
jgi:hypothetical protein